MSWDTSNDRRLIRARDDDAASKRIYGRHEGRRARCPPDSRGGPLGARWAAPGRVCASDPLAREGTGRLLSGYWHRRRRGCGGLPVPWPCRAGQAEWVPPRAAVQHHDREHVPERRTPAGDVPVAPRLTTVHDAAAACRVLGPLADWPHLAGMPLLSEEGAPAIRRLPFGGPEARDAGALHRLPEAFGCAKTLGGLAPKLKASRFNEGGANQACPGSLGQALRHLRTRKCPAVGLDTNRLSPSAFNRRPCTPSMSRRAGVTQASSV